MTGQVRYWFPAKTYGWGWGLPRVWQGWATLVVALLLGVLVSVYVPRSEKPLIYGMFMAGIALALLAVCLTKGEPTAWRWGEK